MNNIHFYQPHSTLPVSKPKKTPQAKTFPIFDEDTATLEIVDLTGLPADSYDQGVEFRSLDDILPPSPEQISEMPDDDTGKTETPAHGGDELPSLEDLVKTCLQRTREAKKGYHKIESPDAVAISKLGDPQGRSQPSLSSSINEPGDSSGNVFRSQALVYH